MQITAQNQELQPNRSVNLPAPLEEYLGSKAAQTGLEGFCKKDTAGWVGKRFDLGRVGEDEYDQNIYRLETLKD